LYTLVTDSGFAYERALVWESLQDVDQAMAAFYDSWFCPSHENSLGLQHAVGSSSEGQPQTTQQQQKDLESVSFLYTEVSDGTFLIICFQLRFGAEPEGA
jgi:hypothetical protein